MTAVVPDFIVLPRDNGDCSLAPVQRSRSMIARAAPALSHSLFEQRSREAAQVCVAPTQHGSTFRPMFGMQVQTAAIKRQRRGFPLSSKLSSAHRAFAALTRSANTETQRWEIRSASARGESRRTRSHTLPTSKHSGRIWTLEVSTSSLASMP
jgi:hypothetical protein